MSSLIGVTPKNYRSIVLYVLEKVPDAQVYCDRMLCTDLSTDGQLTQRGIRELRNFEIVAPTGEAILGFHDHPDEMWFAKGYELLAEHCLANGWLNRDYNQSELAE